MSFQTHQVQEYKDGKWVTESHWSSADRSEAWAIHLSLSKVPEQEGWSKAELDRVIKKVRQLA